MQQRFIELDLGDLHFDPANPRLPSALHYGDDKAIVDWMLQDASLIELMLAIGTNGYFLGEPMLVTVENGQNIVVEGNRRLSSLMLLQNPTYTTVQRTKINRVMALTTERPTLVSCIMFDSRDEINKYLGFKHVTSVKEWSLLAKARYLTQLAQTFSADSRTELYRELAKKIGGYSDDVERLVVSFELYRVIEEADFFNIPGLNEESLYFGYLVDSLNKINIRGFIGVDLKSETPLAALEEKAYSSNLANLIDWFFRKNDDNKTVLKGDSQTLSMLDKVLSHDCARQKFIDSANINAAFEITIETASSFHNNIAQSLLELECGQGKIHKVKKYNPTDISVLEEVVELAGILINTINHKKK